MRNIPELDAVRETFYQVEDAAKPVFVTEYQRRNGCANIAKPSSSPIGRWALSKQALTGRSLIALIGFLKGGCSMSIDTIMRYL